MAASPRRLTFGAHADSYERARPEWPAEAARWLAPGSPRLVVELGAGTGKLTRALAGLGARVLAFEPDERMLAVLRGLGLDGVEALHGSAESIPLGDGAADAVVAGSAFHWFDLEPTLAQAHRVLRPGGTLGIAWNVRDVSDPAMARLAGAIEEARGALVGWQARPWPELLTASSLFRDVEPGRFRHVLDLPRDALDDLLSSYATIAALPEEERDELRSRVARIVEEEPSLRGGGRLTLPYVVDGYRAVAGS